MLRRGRSDLLHPGPSGKKSPVPMAQTTPNASTTRSSRVLLCFRACSSRFRPRPGHARMLTSFKHDIAARLVHAARCRSPAKSRTPGTWRRRLFPLAAGRSRPTRPQASTNERRRSRLLRPTANALHRGSPSRERERCRVVISHRVATHVESEMSVARCKQLLEPVWRCSLPSVLISAHRHYCIGARDQVSVEIPRLLQ